VTPSSPVTLEQLKALAATETAKGGLPKIGEIVSPRYGIPLAREAVSIFARGHADLEAQLGRSDVTFSLITVPQKKNPSTGIVPMSQIEGVCGYVVTMTQYFLNHYVYGNLVSTTYMGSRITSITPIYCEGSSDDMIIELVTVDCTATPDDPACMYTNWSGGPCNSVGSAALAGGRSIYLKSTNEGKEYGVVVTSDGHGGHWYSDPLPGNASSVDFAGVLNHMPPGFVPEAYIHVHPELYQSDDDAKDDTTLNHFSTFDEDVAYDYQIRAYVVVGGQTDMFSWTPPPKPSDPSAPKPNYTTKADSGRLGSVNDGNPGC